MWTLVSWCCTLQTHSVRGCLTVIVSVAVGRHGEMWQRGDSERPSSSVTFQLDIHTFHLSRPRRPAELLPHRVISVAVSPDSPDRGPAQEREGTPGTTAAAVRLDIQGWLIYGAGETLPLLWVSMKRRSWQLSLSPLLHHTAAHGLLERVRVAVASPHRNVQVHSLHAAHLCNLQTGQSYQQPN